MRSYCQRCGYPERTCMCNHIATFSVPQRVIVLQHPAEATVAKNTLKLVKLCMPQTEIIIGEQAQDFQALQTSLNTTNTALIYPSDHAQALESANSSTIDTLIFIDATWRKAHKIMALNPWLKDLPHFSFNQAPQGQYHIRKARQKTSLSTLEAIDYSLSILGNSNTQPLKTAFAEFNALFMSFRQA